MFLVRNITNIKYILKIIENLKINKDILSSIFRSFIIIYKKYFYRLTNFFQNSIKFSRFY